MQHLSTVMADTNQPTVKPFTYVLIPCSEGDAVSEVHFDGNSEDGLRHTITRYFRQQLLSQDQRKDMARHLMEQSKESAKKNAVQRDGETQQEPVLDEKQQEELIQGYLEQTSFEIVPVTMPTRANRFIGTSLYIDDSGAFKDLPVNTRASHIAQRTIRGDAFLLSNHDDPALEEWGRVDCTLGMYDELRANPPKTVYNASDPAQMAEAAKLRETETKVISADDAAKASKAKEEGNDFFAAGDLRAAVQAYSHAIELTSGRRDLLPNEAEVTAVHTAALLNRSLVLSKLHQYRLAANDAREVLQINSGNMKGYYRLAVALSGTHDYAEAKQAAAEFEHYGGAKNDAAELVKMIETGENEAKAAEKKLVTQMFKS